jgi:acetoacetate decarboxylase
MRKSVKIFFLVCLFFSSSLICPGQTPNREKAFTMPLASPLYPPPPLQYRDNRILTVVFRTSPEVLQKLVPKPLVPNPLNLVFLYVSRLNIEVSETENFPYLEAGIGVPAAFSKAMGNHAVYLYLDKALPIAGGREIWGWPKKEATISFVEKDGEITASLERMGFPILSVRAKILKKVEPIPNTPKLPWYNIKIIPSVEKDAPPEVFQLTSTLNKESKIKEYFECETELSFSSSPYDSLGEIEVLEIMDVNFQVNDFVMDFGKILHDYLRESSGKE